MAISNPNEVAKVKHIISLANHLGVALGVGKTEPVNKPEPSMLVFKQADNDKKPITTLPFSQANPAYLWVETPSSGQITIIKNTSTLWVRPYIAEDTYYDSRYNIILFDNTSSEYVRSEGEDYKNYDNLSGERIHNAGEVVIQVAETAQYAAKTWTITITDTD